ncbi:MAG: hypothetical protein M1815_001712 [Lichina confinis]|nr:MAG: hypothetical protein M1815_001712 [Lichina confinis]
MLPASDDCDTACSAHSVSRRTFRWRSAPAVAFASLPFVVTFAVVFTVALHKLYPALTHQESSSSSLTDGHDFRSLPVTSSSTTSRSSRRFRFILRRWPSPRRLSALTFATTIALAAVLAELILCEISNLFDPLARTVITKTVVSSLLVLLIIVTPALELRSIIAAAGWNLAPSSPARWRLARFVEAVGMAAWLAAFWWIGQGLPGTHHGHQESGFSGTPLREACLERIGIVGISLMALLAGFASVSSLWQTFGVKVRPVTESDIARREGGLRATRELLESKRSRLRLLERKLSDAPDRGFVGKMIGSIRGNADVEERKALQMEIGGLDTMGRSLATSLSILRGRRSEQWRASTATGRCLRVFSYAFSVYCLYRIVATSAATLRRWWRPETTFSGTDPITNLLALVAKHWDPSLDRLAWSRQIAFFLSGVMLLASFNSVLQTVHFFSRFTPSVLQRYAHANLALLVGQISATYVVSSALLLRSNVPKEVGSVISDALGAPLDSVFVDRWFESWFLTASGLTAGGILVARKVRGAGGAPGVVGAAAAADWDDIDDDEDGYDNHENDDDYDQRHDFRGGQMDLERGRNTKRS